MAHTRYTVWYVNPSQPQQAPRYLTPGLSLGGRAGIITTKPATRLTAMNGEARSIDWEHVRTATWRARRANQHESHDSVTVHSLHTHKSVTTINLLQACTKVSETHRHRVCRDTAIGCIYRDVAPCSTTHHPNQVPDTNIQNCCWGQPARHAVCELAPCWSGTTKSTSRAIHWAQSRLWLGPPKVPPRGLKLPTGAVPDGRTPTC
jgi:hypothetical protein